MTKENTSVYSLSLNQDHNLISFCSDTGCKIISTNPFHVKLVLEVSEFGTLAICETIHRTNILALVGGGSRPKYAENTVLLWDDKLKRFVLELTFPSKILAVKTRIDMIIVAELDQVHAYSLQGNIQKIFSASSRRNPLGLIMVSRDPEDSKRILLFPGHKIGSLLVADLNICEEGLSHSPVTINAHENEIACITMNLASSLVATASQKGTLIRVFDTGSFNNIYQLLELRRGSDAALLYCLNFSHNSQFLCASSDKGTVHIFALKENHLNKKSSLKGMSFLGSYVDSQWDLANFTVPAERPCICAFGKGDTVFAACVDETFTEYSFTLDGKCNRLSFEIYSAYDGD